MPEIGDRRRRAPFTGNHFGAPETHMCTMPKLVIARNTVGNADGDPLEWRSAEAADLRRTRGVSWNAFSPSPAVNWGRSLATSCANRWCRGCLN